MRGSRGENGLATTLAAAAGATRGNIGAARRALHQVFDCLLLRIGRGVCLAFGARRIGLTIGPAALIATRLHGIAPRPEIDRDDDDDDDQKFWNGGNAEHSHI